MQYKQTIVDQTLAIDFPGHDLDSAYNEACKRMQNAFELENHLGAELRRLQGQIDNAMQDFNRAQDAAQLFYKELQDLENQTQTKEIK